MNEWMSSITSFKPLQATSFAPKKPPVEANTMPNTQSTENISKGLNAGHETFKTTEGNIDALAVGTAQRADTERPIPTAKVNTQTYLNIAKGSFDNTV